jgi:PTS system glucitol/sorbitol-specific IIC component
MNLYTSAATVGEPTGVWGAIAGGAEYFIGIFNRGGEVFFSLLGGIVPTLVVLLTAVNALVRLIGPEKIENLGRKAAQPG